MNTELLARAERLEGFARQDPANAALLRDLAGAYHQAGEHAKALEVLDRCAGDAGDEPALHGLRGQVLLALGRWDDAARLFDSALAREPNAPALLFNTGYALWAAGTEPGRAAALLARAAEFHPANPHVLIHAALAADDAGHAAAARGYLSAALALEPRNARALLLLARLLLQDGETDRAAELADRCIAAQPAKPDGWQLKGEIALFGMDGATASKCLQQALDLDPQDTDTRVSLAQAALLQGRTKHARQCVEAALQREPAHVQALGLLGWLHAADNDNAAARAAFSAAIAADSGAAEAHAGLACVALAEGDVAAARMHGDAALASEPANPLAQLVAARTDELQGAPDRARAAMQDLLAATPFGAAAPSVGGMVAKAGQSRAVQRLQRRAMHDLKRKQGATDTP